MLQHKTIRTMTASRSSQPPAADRPEEFGGELPAENRPASGGPSTSVGAADGGLIVAVDTREQLPWTFPASQRVTLTTGDYSIVGLENQIAIERKSKPDAYGSIGRGRERFEREWARLGELDYAAVVIESTMTDFIQPPPRSRLHPRAAVGTLASWSVRYGVHVVFAGDRRHAAAWTLKVLSKFWEQHCKALHAGEAAHEI